MTIKLGVQGIKGSFSELAAKNFAAAQAIESYTIEYLISSKGVLDAISAEQVNYGILAIENSRGGVVLESVKALASHLCHIDDMFQIPISQNLIAAHGVSLEQISAVHSHRQALRQCRDFLGQHLWGKSLVEETDTAESARKLRDGELPKTSAIIANKDCAELYGLQVLEKDIHDLKNNLTLFLAVTPFVPDNE
jgi:prephenate dehydratase